MGQAATRLIQEEFGANPRYTSRSSARSQRGSSRSTHLKRHQSPPPPKHRPARKNHDDGARNLSKKAASTASRQPQGKEDKSKRDRRRSKSDNPNTKGGKGEASSSAAGRKNRNRHSADPNQSPKSSSQKEPRSSSLKKTIPKQKKTVRITVEEDIIDEYSELFDGPPRECMVCADIRPMNRFPLRPPTTSCNHEANTCRRCLRHWIHSEFNSKLWDQINCPECGIRMQYGDIKEFASSQVFQQYDNLSTRAALEAIPGFRWCIAKGCNSGQVHDQGKTQPKFVCMKCKSAHYIVHNRRWHKNETCAEYDYRTDGRLKKAEEEASKKWIKEQAKKCPKCKADIEKSYGCDHMTCSKCKHQFCWICLAPYGPIRDQGNRMHKPGCMHYA